MEPNAALQRSIFPVISSLSSPYGFAAAWQHSRLFWEQTLAAAGHHLQLLLAVSIIPAALRTYLILKAQPIGRWELNLAEALLTIWRILICAVAIWAVLTPREWQTFKLRLHHTDQIQIAMQRMGAYLGNLLHILLWELLLFALAFWLLHWALWLIAGQLARPGARERRALRRKAISSFLRNLILGPLALIYMVAIMRQAFS
jgi:hypothetical protein